MVTSIHAREGTPKQKMPPDRPMSAGIKGGVKILEGGQTFKIHSVFSDALSV
jgi:hypothetical protein